MNDLPVDAIPPNVQHLQRAEEGLPIQPDDKPIGAGDFCFHVTPFAKLLLKSLVPSKTFSDPSYGFVLADDVLLNRCYVSDVLKDSPASRLFSSCKATRNKIRGAYIIKWLHWTFAPY